MGVIGERFARFIVGVIVVVWVISTVFLPLVIPDYQPPTEVGTIMGIVAGGAVAVLFARRGNGANGNKASDGVKSDPGKKEDDA